MDDEYTSGLVEALKIGYDFCVAYVRDESDGLQEAFLVWVTVGDVFLPDPGTFGTTIPTSATTRLLQSSQLSLLREALCNGLRVTIRHEPAGSLVHGVELHAPVGA